MFVDIKVVWWLGISYTICDWPPELAIESLRLSG